MQADSPQGKAELCWVCLKVSLLRTTCLSTDFTSGTLRTAKETKPKARLAFTLCETSLINDVVIAPMFDPLADFDRGGTAPRMRVHVFPVCRLVLLAFIIMFDCTLALAIDSVTLSQNIRVSVTAALADTSRPIKRCRRWRTIVFQVHLSASKRSSVNSGKLWVLICFVKTP